MGAEAAANIRAIIHYITRWAAKHFGFYLEFYLQSAALATAVEDAAANTGAKIHHKTRWTGKYFDFYSGA